MRRRRRPIRKMIDSEKRASPSLPPSVLITAVLAVCVSVIIPFAALFNYPIPAPARPSLPREHLNRGKPFGVAVGHSERVDQPLAFLLLIHAFTIFLKILIHQIFTDCVKEVPLKHSYHELKLVSMIKRCPESCLLAQQKKFDQ